MSKKDSATPDDMKKSIIQATLAIAAEKDWNQISMQEIADKSGLSLAQIHTHFFDRFDILVGFGRMIDHTVLQDADHSDSDAPPRDALFDLLMDRFEALNEYRDGVLGILRGYRTDPKYALCTLPYLGRSMGWMLESAIIPTNGIKGCLRVAGLKAVYLATIRIWIKDDSPDMAKTMAALDKNLERAELFANSLGK
jgi:AcrR family transcriptional regulator